MGAAATMSNRDGRVAGDIADRDVGCWTMITVDRNAVVACVNERVLRASLTLAATPYGTAPTSD